MSTQNDLIAKLSILNEIAQTLNQAVDVRGVLNQTLAQLVQLMGLETGWIFLRDPVAQEEQGSGGYVLAAQLNLPPALDPDNTAAWTRGCDCQELCNAGKLHGAYNEIRCGRLASVQGDRRGLAMHASSPLRSGNQRLGILNVAASDWSSFSPQALALLTNVGSQMGVALERARLYDLLQEQRIHEQGVLLDFSNQLLSRLDLDDLLGYLVTQVRQVLGVDAAALLMPGRLPGHLEFRATDGWRSDPVAEARHVPGDGETGPGQVMHTHEPLFEADMARPGPTSWNPAWLHAERFRGHAVVPLIANGTAVGTLVVNTRRPRAFAPGEVRLLRLMANQAAMAIEKAKLHQDEIERRALEKELAVGREIQLSLLPRVLPDPMGWEFAAGYHSARLVGGDFYDLFDLPGRPGWLGMVIADVAGKGVPAALFMARVGIILRTVADDGAGPQTVLSRANRLILKEADSGLFLTALYAALDTAQGRLVWSNAGHNPPLWVRSAGTEVQALSAHGMALGVVEAIETGEHSIQMYPGDLLLLYTDGVTESMDANGQLFGRERLEAVLSALGSAGAQDVLESILRALDAHTAGAPQSDDVTLVVVRRCP